MFLDLRQGPALTLQTATVPSLPMNMHMSPSALVWEL